MAIFVWFKVKVPGKLSLDTNNDRMIGNRKTVPLELLIQLYKAGFRKLVPLLPNSKGANVYGDLITEEEFKQFPSAEGKPVRIIYQHPGFWSQARLQEKAYLSQCSNDIWSY